MFLATRKPSGNEHKKKRLPGKGDGFFASCPGFLRKPKFAKVYRGKTLANERLALAELLGAAGLAQTNLLTFDFAGVAGHEAGSRQNGLETRVVVDQSAGDAVAHSTSLAGFAAAGHVHHDVERFDIFGELQGLHDDHAAGFALEEFVEITAVDHDLARAALDENASHRALATAGAVVVVTDHLFSTLNVKNLGLLCGVRVFGASVDLELFDHGVAETALREHTLDRDFESTTGVLGLHFLEGGFVDTARIAGVTVVRLLTGLFSRQLELVSVDHDDVVARIDMRRVFGLVLAAQAECDFGSKAAKHLVAAIDHVPVALYFERLGREGLHCCHLIHKRTQQINFKPPRTGWRLYFAQVGAVKRPARVNKQKRGKNHRSALRSNSAVHRIQCLLPGISC